MFLQKTKIVAFVIVRYPSWSIPFAVLSMAIFRIPFFFNNKISFYKLLGCGKNGAFDLHPDWKQWGILLVKDYHSVKDIFSSEELPANSNNVIQLFAGKFISAWWRFFNCKKQVWIMEPIEGHGKWNDKEAFGILPLRSNHNGKTAVLTRATIKISGLRNFWKNVEQVANRMNASKGFICSVGIGEMPFLRQATFSIWNSMEEMEQFAYQTIEHKDVIQKTRNEKWYKEEMFVRFRILYSSGFYERGSSKANKQLLNR